MLYSSFGNHEEAIKDYQNLIKKYQDDFYYVSLCARQYAQIEDLRSALNLVNNFYKKKKKNAEYYDAIGMILHIVKDYELSIKNHTKAIELEPDSAYSYYNRAKSYKEIGENLRYEKDMKKYRELNAKSRKTTLKTDTHNTKSNKSNILFKIGIILFLIISCIVLYFHPTKEVLHCNNNLTCKVERTYFGVFKTYKKIKLKPTSNLTCHIGAYSCTKTSTNYGLYLRIDGIAPFVFYVSNSSYRNFDDQKKELNRDCNDYYQNFRKYINNYPEYQFKIESKADTIDLIISIIIIATIFFCIFYEPIFKKTK